MFGAARPTWGWYRLTDDWAERVVASALPLQHQLVLDVGAGDGALTSPLLDVGARVVAIERHAGRAASLRKTFEHDNVKVVCADAADLRLPRRPFVVVSNPPFAITTPLLKRLLHPRSRMTRGHLVLQLAAARRWMQGDVKGSSAWSEHYEIRLDSRLPRTALQPAPKVDIALISIVRIR